MRIPTATGGMIKNLFNLSENRAFILALLLALRMLPYLVFQST
jgi:hypothetical protein